MPKNRVFTYRDSSNNNDSNNGTRTTSITTAAKKKIPIETLVIIRKRKPFFSLLFKYRCSGGYIILWLTHKCSKRQTKKKIFLVVFFMIHLNYIGNYYYSVSIIIIIIIIELDWQVFQKKKSSHTFSGVFFILFHFFFNTTIQHIHSTPLLHNS